MVLIRTTGIAKTIRMASVICMIIAICWSGRIEYPIWVLTVLYTLCFWCTGYNTLMINNNYGASIINIVMFFRYIGTPLVIMGNSSLSLFAHDYEHMNLAIVIMAFELIAIFMTLELTGKSYYKKQELLLENAYTIRCYSMRGGVIVAATVAVIIFGLALTYKNLGMGFYTIISGTTTAAKTIEVNNILDIIWQVLCVWLYAYLLIDQAQKYSKTKLSRHVLIIVVISLIFVLITFIESVSFSRWYTIISACTVLTCMCHLFPEKRKFITFSIMSPALILLILITSYKNAGYIVGTTSFTESLINIFNPTNFDSYFSGPVNVNNAIGLKESGQYGFLTLFRDMINNMPIVTGNLTPSSSSVYGYNAYIGRLWGTTGDQIIPLVGQSMIYFGYIFAPLLSIISVFVIRWCDFKTRISNSYMIYIYAFTASWFAVEASMLNFTINCTWFYIRIIPFAIVLYIAENIAKHRDDSVGGKHRA